MKGENVTVTSASSTARDERPGYGSVDQERPPYLWAGLTAVVVLAIYLATLAPTTAFWDTSEYIAAAKVLGIPHPPGNPLFVILAHSFGLLPLAASYAVRINLFAAVTSAASAGLWFLVAERWLRGIVAPRWARYAAAFGGVLVGATSWTVWNQSTVNEKVYTVSLLSIALVMWLVVRWGDDEPGTHRDRWLVLIAYVLALTSTNHLMGVLALPALVVYVLWTDWRTVLRPWAIVTFYALLLALTGEWIAMLHGGAAGGLLILLTLGVLGYAVWKTPRDPLVYLGLLAVIVGISLNYFWLPLRAAQYPAINEGEPVGFLEPVAAGRAEPGAIRQAAVVSTSGDIRLPAGQFLAVLLLAVRSRLGTARRRGNRVVHPAGPHRLMGALEARSAARALPAWPSWRRSRSGWSTT